LKASIKTTENSNSKINRSEISITSITLKEEIHYNSSKQKLANQHNGAPEQEKEGKYKESGCMQKPA
jgi:hypothetical protein